MKKLTFIGSIATAAMLTLTTVTAKPHGKPHGNPHTNPPGQAHRHGTDILHLTEAVTMTNNGAEPGASGTVMLRENQQGNANNQTLDLAVSGLAANSEYELMATLASDTSNYVQADQLTTDAGGSVQLHYRALGNGHNQGHGRGKSPIPAALNPVSQIKGLALFDTNSQPVLTADLTTPNRLIYLIKRSGSSGSISGELQIKATTSKARFQLMASGLEASTDYWLALNGSIVQTNSTDSQGRLKIQSNLDNALDILNLNSVEIWDTSSNVVLSTAIP